MKKHVYSIFLLLCAITGFSQVITPFTVKKQFTQKGGIVYLSNSAVHCAANPLTAGGACQTGASEIPPAGTYQDNSFDAVYVDIDGDPSTFMSSSDSLNLPACSEISWVGLFWGASRTATLTTGFQTIKMKANNGAYTNITAANSQTNTTGFTTYHCYADVTSFVKAAGIKARFTVANILNDKVAGTSTNDFGSWTMVVIYKNDLLTMRQLTCFEGLANISGSATVNIPIAGFLTPLTGPVTFETGIFVHDGDRGLTGDQLKFNGGSGFINITDALNPTTNMMNSTSSTKGVQNPFMKPLLKNTGGLDADIFDPNNSTKNYLGNAVTSCTFQMNTTSETYLPQMITTAIDVYEPDIRAVVRVKDLNGGSVNPGDILEYTMKGLNIGSDPAINSFLVDTLERNISYIPGSIIIVSGPNAGAKTDVLADDQAEYDAATRTVKVRIGTGANGTTGGQVVNSGVGSDSTIVKFRVSATTDCVTLRCDNIVNNRAYIYGTGVVSGNTFNNGSNPGIFDGLGCPIPGTTDTPISTASCSLLPDVSGTLCSGTSLSTLFSVANYTFFTSSFAIAPATPTVAGIYYAINTPYPGCGDTVKITVTSVVGCDADGDGVPNAIDTDDDNDGIPDLAEGTGDTDGDGTPDYLDLDSDNDGIFDVTEAGGSDPDNNGFPGSGTPTTNASGQVLVAATPVVLTPPDTDGDGKPNYLDLDSDNDGITDVTEAGFGALDVNNDGVLDGTDTDGDGIVNVAGVDTNSIKGGTGSAPANTDGDGVPNYLDLDSDNDGIYDVTEAGFAALDTDNNGVLNGTDTDNDGIINVSGVDNNTTFGGTTTSPNDKDGDGKPNYLDLDSDNDGITDVTEAGFGALDTNNDGLLNGTDTDGDGIINVAGVDTNSTFGGSGSIPLNTDGDGVPNYLDLDSDNDGIFDVTENGNGALDTNNDGVLNGTDTDGDGVINVAGVDTNSTFGSTTSAPLNLDGDSKPNYLDIDSDNDGITDVVENGNGALDTNNDGKIDGTDTDGDGIINVAGIDANSSFGGTALAASDKDGDGKPNFLDLDSDNDGLQDVIEAGGTDADNNGTIGTGAFTDTDGDGWSNITDASNGGTALPIPNTDGDGVANYLDLDSDNDGITDVIEAGGTDADGNGTIGTGALADTDGDGWSNITDSDNAGTALANLDSDGDGHKNYLDIDSDNDGIIDNIEGLNHSVIGAATGLDTDNDGIDNAYDINSGAPIIVVTNSDSDTRPNYIDIDSDNDGIVDNIEFQSSTGYVAPGPDTDGNGLADVYETAPGSGTPVSAPYNADGTDTPDYVDLDSDNDVVSLSNPLLTDMGEAFGATVPTGLDSDNDGLDNAFDLNPGGMTDPLCSSNGGQNVLGLPNTQDPNTIEVDFRDPILFSVPIDTDGDGITNDIDVDDDNDGILDVNESLGFQPTTIIGSPCTYPGTNFNGNTLIAGTAGAVGAKYRFTNVMTVDGNVLDAIVEIKAITGGAVLLDIDNNLSGSPANWQPEYSVPLPTGNVADMEFEVTMVTAGTTVAYPLGRFGGVIYDIDGANARESVILDRPGLYAVDAQTLLNITPNSSTGKVTFQGPDDTYAGVSLAPRLAMYFNYYNIPTFKIRFSAQLLGSAANTNLGAVSFDICGINGLFTPSNTVATLPSQTTGTFSAAGPGSSPVYVVNDGIDTDKDGIADQLDLDADNDGIPDVTEAGGSDPNGDGHPGAGPYVPTAVDANGLPTILTGTPISLKDFDNDGIPNTIDLDSDNDGIADVIEAGGTDPNGDGLIGNNPIIDADHDGLADSVDPLGATGTPLPLTNTDGDGQANYLDLDSDNDGITDVIEAGGVDADGDGFIGTGTLVDANHNGWSGAADFNESGNTLPLADTDGDGVKNYLDLDSDNDGIYDVAEAGFAALDTDNNGLLNGSDTDADGIINVSGVDTNTLVGGTGSPVFNTDGDGQPNYVDLDSDNDGLLDVVENGNAALDTNNDGMINGTDTDNDGIINVTGIDANSSYGGTGSAPLNFDGDSKPNYLDIDSDNDGITDVKENNGTDANNDGAIDGTDTDNDGILSSADTYTLFGGAGNPVVNTDNNGKGNYLDIDADNDGIVDNIEGQTTTGYIAPTGTDTDGDGLDDAYDTTVGFAGNGISPTNTDGADSPDYLDLDSDNDSNSDNIEGWDTNGNDVINGSEITASGADADNDGLDDAYDSNDLAVNPTNGQTPNNFPNVEVGTGPEKDWRDPELIDTDGDGIADPLDLDDDNDGIPDLVEGNGDTDGDDVINSLDLDSDNDGILDVTECGGNDPDGDGIVGTGTPVVNTSGQVLVGGSPVVLTAVNTDGDGQPNFLDLDSDNDGIFDVAENGKGALDTNNDGILNGADTDGDGIINVAGVDTNTTFGGTTTAPLNFDGDSKPNYLDIDSDNDGITDVKENNGTDANNDGMVDGTDSDNDGVVSSVDSNSTFGGTGTTPVNTDANGNPNYIDIDSDNDGIVDNIEGQTTTGYVAPTGTDTDGDGLDNAYDTTVGFGGSGVNPTNTDSTDSPDYTDTDTDNDGDLDAVEGWDTDNNGTANITPAGTDTDNDGLDDAYDNNDAVVNPTNGQTPSSFPNLDNPTTSQLDWRDMKDTDNDGVADIIDIDDDNDGILDTTEYAGCSPSVPTCDFDGDGIPNSLDLDSDNDGIADVLEGGSPDTNNDGKVDGFVDTNNDGLSDVVAAASGFPGTAVPDSDGDGHPDYLDLDSDNDGIADVIEGGTADTNGDGKVDGFVDANHDGLNDATLAAGNTLGGLPVPDSDGDGIPDYLDLDSDQDGIADVLEGGSPDINGDGHVDGTTDVDGDGWNDTVDNGTGIAGPAVPDTDGDGHPDYLDLDADNDGIADVIEGGSPDTNNDGHVDGTVDADGDGWIDTVDNGTGTSGPAVPDTDGDGTPDYLDLDSDGDTIPDVVEGGSPDANNDGHIDNPTDTNGNGWSDGVETGTGFAGPTVPDTDGDGIPNFQDLDSDGDGLVDADEAGSNPNTPQDTDGNGIPDYLEPPQDLVVPQIFTPNGDGINDVVKIKGIQAFPDAELQIMNRWGNLVYKEIGTDIDDKPWNGKNTQGVYVGGDELPVGTYFYILEPKKEGFKAITGYIYLQR